MRACLLALGVFLLSARAWPHHLDLNRLELRPPQGGELRGRFLLVPDLGQKAGEVAESALLTRLQSGIELNVGGQHCSPSLALVELWNENSPSPGHLVDLRCPLPGDASRLSLDVTWRDQSDLLVVYPATETTAAVSTLLAPGQGTTIPLRPPGAMAAEVPPAPTAAAPPPGVRIWLALGFRHVLPGGLDHVLFVLSLALSAASLQPWRSLLPTKLIAFTLTHGLALYLGALGLVSASARWIEPLIALTIVLSAAPAIGRPPSEQGSVRARVAGVLLVTVFGFIHGLGFADAFGTLTTRTSTLIETLVVFHVGVELGQLTILALALASLALLRRLLQGKGSRYELTVRAAALGVALLGSWLFVGRILAAT